MTKRILLLLPLIAILLYGCRPSKEKTITTITTLEKQLYSGQAMTFNRKKADSLLVLYEKFFKRFPKDTLAPKYLFQSAGLAMTLGDGKKSLALYDKFMKQYPDNPKAPVCMFFKGYVYENFLTDLDKAKETYLLFIEKYPANEFVKDARVALSNLGKTPEQLVREFEVRQKEETARIADSLAVVNGKKK